jgi:hypothetical protein
MIKLLEPAKVTIRYIPPGAGYAYETRTIQLEKTDIPSLARGHLEKIKTMSASAAGGSVDAESRYHFLDLKSRIEQALDPK